jgi:hypothetical protein
MGAVEIPEVSKGELNRAQLNIDCAPLSEDNQVLDENCESERGNSKNSSCEKSTSMASSPGL